VSPHPKTGFLTIWGPRKHATRGTLARGFVALVRGCLVAAALVALAAALVALAAALVARLPSL
jgi:hypothetical protein